MSRPLQQVFRGDARAMPELADHSVHLVITSPPYWQLKDYGSDDQLGYHDSYETYINDLNLVWMACERVLHPGCRLCINIGDQFARASYYGRYKVIPIRTEIIRCCEALGLDYMGAIIWQKVTTCNTSGGASVMGSFPHPRNGVIKLDYEFILIFKKPGKQPKVSKELKQAAAMTTEEWNDFFAGHWRFPGERQDEHIAPFPVELPSRLIRMFSFPGELVLDPFLGSGTTLLAASNLDRAGVGYEINPDYLPTIRKRLGAEPSDLFSDLPSTIPMQVQELEPRDLEAARQALPYRFTDPVKVTRKADPKARNYGSRISPEKPEKVTSLRVQAVPAADRLTLSDGRQLRLAGILPIPGREAEAMDFLLKKTRKTTVSVTTEPGLDAGTADAVGYVHLKNMTHLNAHLIKAGLAGALADGSYRHKQRFLTYAEEARA